MLNARIVFSLQHTKRSPTSGRTAASLSPYLSLSPELTFLMAMLSRHCEHIKKKKNANKGSSVVVLILVADKRHILAHIFLFVLR